MKWILAFVLTLISAEAAADRVGQGAGMSENNIQFAYRYLDKYIQLCLAIKGCTENATQTEVLQKELASLPEERKVPNQIGFKPEKAGIFFVDGKMREAVTWNYVGAPIYFNLDEIYYKDQSGQIVGISIQAAVALLVHEMGHHQGVLDHDWLDHLGERVSRVLDGRMFSSPLSPTRLNISESYIYFDAASPGPTMTEVLLTDGPHLYDISSDIQALPWCGGTGAKLVGLALWNFMWRDGAYPVLTGFAKPTCQSGGTQFVPAGLCVAIKMRASLSGQQIWQIDPASISVSEILCGASWNAAEIERRSLFQTINNPNQEGNP